MFEKSFFLFLSMLISPPIELAYCTIKNLNIATDRSERTVQTLIADPDQTAPRGAV